MIVCVCKGVSDRDVAAAIAAGAQSVQDITRCTRAGSGCGRCRVAIQESLDMAHGRLAKPVVRLSTLAAIASG